MLTTETEVTTFVLKSDKLHYCCQIIAIALPKTNWTDLRDFKATTLQSEKNIACSNQFAQCCIYNEKWTP